MTPDQTLKNKKYAQLFLILVLSLILASIIGLYIYFGMKQAGKNVVIDTATSIPSQASTLEDAQARRAKILENLAKESSATTSPEERAQVLENLSKELGVSTTSAENRMKVLKALPNDNNQAEPVAL